MRSRFIALIAGVMLVVILAIPGSAVLAADPVIEDQSVTIPEDATSGTTTTPAQIAATDPESGALTFTSTGGSGQSMFDVSTGGIITYNGTGTLDYESTQSYTLIVQVTDSEFLTDTATVTINLTNVSDVDPTIENQNFSVPENSPNNTVVGTIAVTDPEDDNHEFSVAGGSGTSVFSVDSNTGQIKVIDSAALDFEAAPPSYTLIVEVKDVGSSTSNSATMTITKTNVNEPPTTTGIDDVPVNEDAANTTIDLYTKFSDPEDEPSELTYTVPSNSNPGLVSVSISSGQFLVLDYVANANGFATIKVKATDTGGLFKETQFKVTVTAVNDKPTTTGLANIQVDEDSDIAPIELYPAFADLEDADSALVFSVTGNTNAGLFTDGTPKIIASAGGKAVQLKLKPNTFGVATITVRATDTGSEYVETSFTVTVDAVADVPTVTDFSRSIDEDTLLTFTEDNFKTHFTVGDGPSLVKVKIVSLPANGTLKLSGAPVQANDEIVTASLNNLTFQPNENWNGTTTFKWNGSDGSGYAAAPATVTIDVKPANDPPKVSNFIKVGNEDETLLFTKNDFLNAYSGDAYFDTQNKPLVSVRIETLPLNGQLKLGNNNVTLNQVIVAADLDTLKFVPAPDWSGTTSFEWNASDGEFFALEPALVNISINAKNDAPVLDLNGPDSGTGYTALFVANAGPVLVAGPDTTISDLDNTSMKAAYVRINEAPDVAAEKLAANSAGTNITVNYSAGNHTLTLQGPDTIENFIKVLKTVTYENTSATPDSSDRSIGFRVDDGLTSSNTAFTTVQVVHPAIELTVTPLFQTVLTDGTAVFSISVVNVGDVALTNVRLDSPVADCNKGLIIGTLLAGEDIPRTCTVEHVTERIDNVLTVTADYNPAGLSVSSTQTAIVRVDNPNIYVQILPDPHVGYTVAKGADVPLLVIVGNPSLTKLKDVSLDAILKPIVVGDGLGAVDGMAEATDIVCDFPAEGTTFTLNGNEEREFNCTVNDVAASIAAEVSAEGTIEGDFKTVSDFDLANINVLDITLQATANIFELPVGDPTDVEFGITLTNFGSAPVTLTELTSRKESNQMLHGNLLNAANPSIKNSTCGVVGDPPVIAADGGTFACKYTATITGEIPEFVNRINFTVEDVDANSLSGHQDIELAVVDNSGVRAILNAEPTTLLAPGGDIELLVQIRNNLAITATLEGLQDAQLGNLDGEGDCAVPQEIGPGESYLCSYKVTRDGLSPGDELTFELTATVDGDSYVDDVVVRVTERSNKMAILPVVSFGAVAGEPNNSSCSALPLNTQMDYFFLADDLTDWYKVVLTSPGTVEFQLNNYMVVGQLNVFIAPECAQQLPTNDPDKFFSDGSNAQNKKVKIVNAQPGTYFIRIYGPDPDGPGPYTSTIPYTLKVVTTP